MNEINTMLSEWDKGKFISSIEMIGLGPGYEQALQIAAVEFARACKGMKGMKDDKASREKFRKKCLGIVHIIDRKLLGFSGAQLHAAEWLSWQWCFNGGPKKLLDRYSSKKLIFVCKSWPHL